MAKQAIKKGATIKKKSLSDIKGKLGIATNEPSKDGIVDVVVSNANKPMEWLIMPQAYTEACRLPGVPQSVVSIVQGHSNVGKSTFVNHVITAAQRQGLIPVIIDTENNFSFQYAKSMGFEAEPVYGNVKVETLDPETGEYIETIENRIVNWEGNFIYYNNKLLAESFGDMDYSKGVKTKTKRKDAVVEDVAACINTLLDMQDNGDIEQGLCFVWDSVGSIGCYKEYSAGRVANAMWTAAAISQAFNNIINNRIPSSRKISSKYSNTLVCVNKVWMDSMTNPVGPAIQRQKGGQSLFFSCRVCYVLGGQLTSAIKRLTATSKGCNYNYGIETKIKVIKNHLDAPYNVTYEGKLIATDVGFISPNEIDNYKKEHVSTILKQLNDLYEGEGEITAEDIQFGEEEVNEEV